MMNNVTLPGKSNFSTELRAKWQRIINTTASVTQLPVALLKSDNILFMGVYLLSQSPACRYKQGDRIHFKSSQYDRKTATIEDAYSENNQDSVSIIEADAIDFNDGNDIYTAESCFPGFEISLPDGIRFGKLCFIIEDINCEIKVEFRNLLEEFSILINNDIKHLKHTGNLAIESKFWRAIQSAATESVIVVNKNSKIVSINEIGAQRFGKPDSMIIGRSISELAPNDVANRRIGFLQNVLQSRKAMRFEDCREGRYYDYTIYPVIDENLDDVEHLVVFASDITARRETEDALRESEKRLNKAQKIGQVGVWEWLPQTGELLWSDETYNILGFSPGEIVPSYELFMEMVHADDRERFNNAVQRAMYEKKIFSEEYRVITCSGTEKITYAQGEVRYDENDNPIQMLGTFQDVTERKKIAKELEKYKNQLEKLVALRTTELQNSNRELESYSYSIAHDLRAPLRAITGFSQILMDDTREKLDAEELDILERIVLAGKNMSDLIDDILELSRITRTELCYTSVNLTKLARQIMKRFDSSQTNRIVQWHVDSNINAEGDARLLEVVMQNLIDNAWKYSREEPIALIRFGVKSIDGNTTYYIEDNGVGFNMRFHDRLYQPFRRLHPAEEFEGTGVGLATVQRVIQRHGGQIWAESQEGQGAIFYFTLRKYTA